ncbi:fibronectin type III domain-containing protein [Pengzhenrongella phosphoraccumulans]|uniref:fibronectin type III domain-containing protein n=1 Tax=Pengzhenrongella phosphoraccumulans TaxID=3114394 RepID=UPI0038907212
MSAQLSVATRRGVGRLSAWLTSLVVVVGLLTVGAAPASAAVPVTYPGPSYAAVAGVAPSADKPQSKLWYAQGAWWAVMRTPAGPITVHKLAANHTWSDTGVVVDDRAASTADVLLDGGKIYLTSRVATGAMEVVRMSFVPASGLWQIDAGFPVSPTTAGSESASIARDSLGHLWVTWTSLSKVWVSNSTTSDLVWSTPVQVPVPDTSVAADDISAIVAFAGKIGIMWSDQVSLAFRFAVHPDNQPADAGWTMETPLSGPNFADDHINIKSLVDDNGRIFAAVKTSRGDSGEPATDPLIMVLSRAANGTWSSAVAGTVGDNLTRPQLVIDATNRELYVLMTSPTAGGVIYYKHAPLTSIAFGPGRGQPFVSWPGALLNNVSTAKDPVTAATGLVALATDEARSRYYFAQLDLAATPPPDAVAPSVPVGVSAVASGSTSVVVSWSASTDNVGVTGYRVLRDGGVVATVTGTTLTDSGLSPGGTYAYTVVAFDAAGNASAPSAPATVTMPGPVVGPPSFHGAATTSTASGSSVTAPLPVGAVTGDVLVVVVSMRGQVAITTPAGWTLVRTDSNTSTTMRQAIYTATVGVGSPASRSFKLARSISTVVQVLAYGGVDAAAPVLAHAAQVRSAGSTLTAPAVTAPAGSVVVGVFAIARATSLTPVGDLIERTEATNSGSSRLTTSTDETSPTTGPLTVTATGSAASITATLALRPQG